ncbi:MAG: hypothetical protein AB3N33_05360 [Puniceicoccaceae bacterium]
MYRFLLLLPVLLPAFTKIVAAQSLRAAYQFADGKAWSAAVNLPGYDILDLGPGQVPLAVSDSGIALLQSEDHRLIRWTWGREEVLLEGFFNHETVFMNESGLAVAINPAAETTADVLYWDPGETIPNHLSWAGNLFRDPHFAELYALNDQGILALRAESTDNQFLLPPATLEIETNLVDLAGESWDEQSLYRYFNDIDLTLTQGGRLYAIEDLNNYGDTIGLVYEDEAFSTAFEPDPVYSYQNQYFALNRDTALDFEPLLLNDAGTIVGRTLGPVHAMVVLDRFGQRYPGPLIDDEEAAKIRMSSPVNGMEEIILGENYWCRMQERDLLGNPLDTPSPDFWWGTVTDIVNDSGDWVQLEATCISANGRIAGTGWLYDPLRAAFARHGFLLVPPALLPDWNRDGIIDDTDRRLYAPGQPLHFWVNDDDDSGNLSQTIADDQPASPTPDWASPGIDGLRDVVDFFAVQLDLQEILQAIGTSGSVEIILRQADEALNLVYTNLYPQDAGSIHREHLATGFGPAFAEPLDHAPTTNVTAAGISLTQSLIRNIRLENRGVLLFEALRPTQQPLVMELYRAGEKVLTSRLPLSIGSVRDMFRVINLRNADPKFDGVDPGPWATSTEDPPNLPDAFLEKLSPPLRTLVHIHGYNWSGHEIPAGHSEIFKRFFQAGSNARFVGVTWRGDEGTLDLTGSSFEYNENVINAFITAKYVKDSLVPFAGPRTAIFAHSLGNMVTSSAITDHGLEAGLYFMTNAAVPEEAYAGETANRRNMVPPEWKDEVELGVDYAEFLLSPNWYRLFSGDDHRSFLKWKDRFASLSSQVSCINFYSSGEEVLKSGNGDLPSLLGDAANQERVWVFNEMVKGTETFLSNLVSDIHGGWGFNRYWMDWVDPGGAAHPPPGSWVPMSTSEAALINPADLIPEPFFRKFSDGDSVFPLWGDGAWLYGDTATANAHLPALPLAGASIDTLKNHAKILAEAIPAHSDPAGSNPLSNLPLLRNIDLDRDCRDPGHWPAREDAGKRDRWLHGDYLRPALSHVARFYLTCVSNINKLP